MIEVRQGNIFEADAEALVNPVNCLGIMGAGLANQFRNKFPVNYYLYRAACQKGAIKIGKVYVVSGPPYIINFPTKYHPRNSSKIEDIEKGLDDLKTVLQNLNISSVAVPALGCGLGQLNWKDVKPIIIEKLKDSSTEVYLYEPH